MALAIGALIINRNNGALGMHGLLFLLRDHDNEALQHWDLLFPNADMLCIR
jgi:hypothetical protein